MWREASRSAGFKSPSRGNTNTAQHSARLVQVRSPEPPQRQHLNHMREFLLSWHSTNLLSKLSCGSNSLGSSPQGRRRQERKPSSMCPENLVLAQSGSEQLWSDYPGVNPLLTLPREHPPDNLHLLTDSPLQSFLISRPRR